MHWGHGRGSQPARAYGGGKRDQKHCPDHLEEYCAQTRFERNQGGTHLDHCGFGPAHSRHREVDRTKTVAVPLLRAQRTPALPGLPEGDRFQRKIMRQSSVAREDPPCRVMDDDKTVDVLDEVIQRYALMHGKTAVCG